MTAQLERWPVAQPVVTGDDVAMLLTFDTTDDLTGTTWESIIRQHQGGPEVARWEPVVDPVAKTVTLLLSAAESVKVGPGCGYDVRQTGPTTFTWLTVATFNIVPSYSTGAP
jgi:hypothetical protein